MKQKQHERITKLLLGSDYKHIHKFLDFPYLFLGKKHRKLFHDTLTPLLVGFILKDKKAYDASNLHIISDKVNSYIRKYYKLLNLLK